MKTLLLCFLVSIQFSSFSQDWGTYYSNDTITIEYKLYSYTEPSHSIEHQRIVFRYTNNLADEISLSFDRIHAYDGVELSSSPERHFDIVLSANETISYTEETARDKQFYIFSKDINGTIKRKLSAFDIINIQCN